MSADAIADGQAVPAVGLLAQAAPPRGGEAVELRAAVVLGHAPFGVEKALVLEPVERGVERALFDEQRALRDLLDAGQHAVAMQRAERHRLEDEDVERARKEVGLSRQMRLS